jgi:hypothetical protein
MRLDVRTEDPLLQGCDGSMGLVGLTCGSVCYVEHEHLPTFMRD